VQRSKGKTHYYPCRKCCADEIDGLFEEDHNNRNKNKNKMVVRFLGWKWHSAGQYDPISETSWRPLVLPDTTTTATTTTTTTNDDEVFLSHHLRAISKELEHDPVALKTEELVVRAMWQKVQQREQEEPPPATKPLLLEYDDDDTTTTFLRMTKEEEDEKKEERITDHTTFRRRAFSRPESEDDESSSDDNDHDNDNDKDDNAMDDLPSPGFKAKKKVLRTGDVISYYDPIAVAGKEEWWKQATIVGIAPKKKTYPLNLDNGQLLDRDHRIQRVQKMHRGTLIACHDAIRPIRGFSLPTSGTQQLLGLQRMAQHGKQMREEHAQAMDQFWEQPQPQGGGAEDVNGTRISGTKPPPSTTGASAEEEPNDNPTTTTNEIKKARQRSSLANLFSEPARGVQQEVLFKPAEPAWKIHLTKLLDTTRTNIKAKKRYDPSMTPDQLELVLKVWSTLLEQQRVQQQQSQYSSSTTKEAVKALADTLDMSVERVNAVMHGDEHRTLSAMNKLEVTEALETWLHEQPPPLVENANATVDLEEEASTTDHYQMEVPILTTPSRRKRSLATSSVRPPPSTNRRKHQKQEDAQSLKQFLDDPTRSSSTHTRRSSMGMSDVPAATTPSRRRRTMGGASPAALLPPASATRRTRHPSDASHDLGLPASASASASRRKRGHSEVGILASSTTREIIKTATSVTPAKKRPAHPAFEPAPVKRRKKQQQANLMSRSFTSDSVDTMPRKKRRETIAVIQKPPSEPKQPSPIEMARKTIHELIERVKKSMETEKRYNPHLTVEQLELLLKVWTKISEMEPTKKVEKIVMEMSDELEVSHSKLTRLLTGDKENQLSEGQIENVSERLKTWLVEDKEGAPTEEEEAIAHTSGILGGA
jgi:hypothetical protein